MPANVTIDFEKANLEFQQANSNETKLAALLKMQSLAPSHKGGEKLRKDISKKIAALKKTIEKHKAREKKKGKGASIAVRKDGLGQIALIGLPNSGKSSLLNKLTGVGEKVAVYPFTTKKPAVGMMNYFGGQVQIVELPAIVEGSSQGKANGPKILSIARNADAIVIVAKDREEEELVEKELSLVGISLNKKRPGMHLKKGLVINAFEEQKISSLKKIIFQLLGKIIIYTKKPGNKPDYSAPLGLAIGSTVKDAASHLHKDIEKKIRFARVWGSTKFLGQKVSKDYELQNKDVVEIFT